MARVSTINDNHLGQDGNQVLQDSQKYPSAGDQDKSISPISAHDVSPLLSLSGRSWWGSGSALAKKLQRAEQGRGWLGSGRRDGIREYPHCVPFPLDLQPGQLKS